jgi:hypothetical protein
MTRLIVTGACLLAALPAVAQTSGCAKTGSVFSIDPVGNVLLLKEAGGYIDDISFTPKTVFTKLAIGESGSGVRVQASSVQVGDFLCVEAQDGSNAARVAYVTHGDAARAQLEFLVQWQHNSTFGLIESMGITGKGFVVSPALADSDGVPVRVLLDDNTRFRKFGDNAVRLSDASPIQYEDLQVGEQVYVRGTRADGDPVWHGTLVIKGGVRGILGTILSVDTVQSSLRLREFGSGRKFDVSLPSGDVYKANDAPTDPVPVNTLSGVPLVRIALGDLMPGDAVLALGSSKPENDKVLGLGVITKFGNFGVGPVDSGNKLNWLLE